MSEQLCRRIHDNILALVDERATLQAERDRAIAEIRRLGAELNRTRDELSVLMPGRIPDFDDLIGIGSDIADAIRNLGNSSNSREILRLEDEIAGLEGVVGDLEDKIARKTDLIADQQSEFVACNCFDHGFSHNVLNLRGLHV